MRLHRMDCLKVLRKMPSDSVDSIVTDPPYGISVMDQDWDNQLPQKEIWRECFRVLRPGGYILAFASARIYHQLAIMMERAGFETHNMLAWIYSNGFPRGQDMAMQLDRGNSMPVPDDKFRAYLKDAIKRSGYRIKDLERRCGTSNMFTHYLGKSQPQFPSYERWQILKKLLQLDCTYDSLFAKIKKCRRQFKLSRGKGRSKSRHFKCLSRDFNRHEAQSRLAKKWQGYKCGKIAIRPCIEPIYFGQKPPLRPVRQNLIRYGIGAINIEGCKQRGRDGKLRTPSSVMHDGSRKVFKCLGQYNASGQTALSEFPRMEAPFFYVSKPCGKARTDYWHPTMKPLQLMRQLVRLVTPAGKTCLDPFMGSGTTGEAASLEGVDFIGIEKEAPYYRIACKRLKQKPKPKERV